jgi:hypothetical protein
VPHADTCASSGSIWLPPGWLSPAGESVHLKGTHRSTLITKARTRLCIRPLTVTRGAEDQIWGKTKGRERNGLEMPVLRLEEKAMNFLSSTLL